MVVSCLCRELLFGDLSNLVMLLSDSVEFTKEQRQQARAYIKAVDINESIAPRLLAGRHIDSWLALLHRYGDLALDALLASITADMINGQERHIIDSWRYFQTIIEIRIALENGAGRADVTAPG